MSSSSSISEWARSRSRWARESRATRTISSARSPISVSPSTSSLPGSKVGCKLRRLAIDTLVAHPLEVDRVVEDGEHEAQVSEATGPCWARIVSMVRSISW